MTMLNLACVLISVLAGFGMATVLVEKKREWPVRRYHLLLLLTLRKIHPRAPRMLNCTVCTSFWTTLVCDVFLFVFSGFHYWAWPISGFATAGFTWFIIQFLNALDTPSVILPRSEDK